MSAALDLVGDRGVESVTVGGVCERASVAKRYFYEGFATLDDLLAATLTDALHRVAVEVGASAPDRSAPIEPLITSAVDAVLRAFDDPRVARLYLESPGNAGLRAARSAAVSDFVELFLLLLEIDEKERPAARVVVHVLVAGTTEVVAMWLRGDLGIDRPALVARLADLGAAATRLVRPS